MTDYEQLVKDLRTTERICRDRMDGQVMHDAAAAIESLQAEVKRLEPKRGEWISEWDGFEFDVRCSVCGEMALIKEGGSHDHKYSNYCPNCGAKMEVQE